MSKRAIEAPHPRETTAWFGHVQAERALLDAFRSGLFPHAWLIGGPPGVGKATLAYRMARFVLAHAGGLMPYFAWRLSISPMIDKRLEQLSPADIYARLGRFWYDNALSPTAETLACVERLAPAGQIVFGSDWPFANARVISQAVKAYEAVPLSEARRGAIDCGNALSLFPQWA